MDRCGLWSRALNQNEIKCLYNNGKGLKYPYPKSKDTAKSKITVGREDTTYSRTACDGFVSPSGQYTWTSSGSYSDTLSTANGCDSVITVNLTIHNSTFDTIQRQSCQNYTVPSGDETYSKSGTYKDTIPNNQGCDSLIQINLTINNSNSTSEVVKACDSFKLPGGQTVYESGDYEDTLTNEAGCDSVVTFQVEIKEVDTTVNQNGSVLTANETEGSYQWLSCDSVGYSKINNATSRTYQAEDTGNYAVKLMKGPCVDTSICHRVESVGLASEKLDSEIDIYPNPTRGDYIVELSRSHEQITLKVEDVTGRQVTKRHLNNVEQYQGRIEGAAGIYFIKIITQDGQMVKEKMVKQ